MDAVDDKGDHIEDHLRVEELLMLVMMMTRPKTFLRLKSCLAEWEDVVLVSPDMGGAKRL